MSFPGKSRFVEQESMRDKMMKRIIFLKAYSSSLNSNTTLQTATVAPFLAWRSWRRNAHLRQTAESDTNRLYQLCKEFAHGAKIIVLVNSNCSLRYCSSTEPF